MTVESFTLMCIEAAGEEGGWEVLELQRLDLGAGSSRYSRSLT